MNRHHFARGRNVPKQHAGLVAGRNDGTHDRTREVHDADLRGEKRGYPQQLEAGTVQRTYRRSLDNSVLDHETEQSMHRARWQVQFLTQILDRNFAFGFCDTCQQFHNARDRTCGGSIASPRFHVARRFRPRLAILYLAHPRSEILLTMPSPRYGTCQPLSCKINSVDRKI